MVAENQREVFVPVIRAGHQSGIASVYYKTIANSAIAQQDYLPTQGSLTWNESDNDLIGIVIPILDDNQPEREEHFIIQLVNPSENVQLGQLAQIEIQDDDNNLPPSLILPNLSRGMILNQNQTLRKIELNCQTFSCLPITAFRGGSSINRLSYYNPLQLSQYQPVTVKGEIDVEAEAEHVGQLADLLIMVAWQPHDLNEPVCYWMQDQQGQFISWDLSLTHLVAVEEQVRLTPTPKINFYTGTLNTGKIQLFFGYRLADGVIIFNGEPAIELMVTK